MSKSYRPTRPDDTIEPVSSLAGMARLLRRAPRAYLPDDRFATAVAFIIGFDIGQGGAPLVGFREFLLERLFEGKHSPYHWGYLILAAEDYSLLGHVGLRDLSADLDERCTRRMLDLLLEFTAPE